MIVTPNDARSYDKVLKLTKKEPALVVVDLDWDEAKAAGERDAERRKSRGGDRDRSAGRRDERRSRPVKDHGERASMEALSPASEATPLPAARPTERSSRNEAAALGSDRPERPSARSPGQSQRRERAPVPTADRAAKSEAVERPARQTPARPSREDSGPTVLGFGADTPAFLMRGPTLTAAPKG